MHRKMAAIRLGKEATQNFGTDAASLVARVDVEVVQMETVLAGAKGIKADALPVHDDELGLLGVKRLAKALARALRIEAPDPFQTLAHRCDAQCDQLLE